MDCDLCRIYEKREIITTLRFEDDQLIIVDCMICSVPMVVAKQHNVPVPEALDSLMEERLREVADGILGPENYYVDKHERLIADHRHFHARRKGALVSLAGPGLAERERCGPPCPGASNGARVTPSRNDGGYT